MYWILHIHVCTRDGYTCTRTIVIITEREKNSMHAAIKIYSHSSALILNLHLRERIQVKLETSARSIKIKFYDLELYLKIIYFYLCIVQSRKEEN